MNQIAVQSSSETPLKTAVITRWRRGAQLRSLELCTESDVKTVREAKELAS
jgi:hypothetical protein